MQLRNIRNAIVTAIVGLGLAPFALAQGVGNLGSLPTQFATTAPPTGWNVGGSAGPIPVVLDPAGPMWGKSFTGPNGGPFLYPPTSPSNPPLNVSEMLQVAGNLPWTDWHEEVIGIDVAGAPDFGWSWANPFILVNGQPATGLSITGVGTNTLSFFFDPVAPGSIVQIRKELVYTGNPGAVFAGTLAVHEYPTGVPEPATLGLLGVAALCVLRRR